MRLSNGRHHSCIGQPKLGPWSRTMHISKRLYYLVLAALLAAFAIHAQVAGRLSGVVMDQSGAAIPGATINIYVSGGKEPVLTGQSNESGVFSFVSVRPDTYDVAVESKG